MQRTNVDNSNTAWEQRWHPFRGEWVLFTSHRGGRPWVGAREEVSQKSLPPYDSNCTLCPGNDRVSGERNPEYAGVFGFTNDLPPFSRDAPRVGSVEDPLYRTEPALGTAEVVCYHPDHSKTMADLDEAQVREVVDYWSERYEFLGERPEVRSVHIFENKGAIVGASNPHPHCQIYAASLVYETFAREARVASRYYAENGKPIGLAVADREAGNSRVVCENDSFIACVPWFALFAYEVLILPRFRAASLLDLSDGQRTDLASIIRRVVIRYDNLWEMPLPYIMVVHQAPTDGGEHAFFPFHIEFHPLLRKPDTLKYLGGAELGGGTMTNESVPEEKAAELRAVSEILYRA